MTTSTHRTRYEALAQYVRDRIEQGAFQPGERLPSVRQMAELRQVSVTTVLEGYRRLEDWGLIAARPQSGYYVQSPPTAQCEVPRVMEPHPRTKVVGRSALIRDLLQEAQTGAQVPLGAAVLHPELLPQRMLARMQSKVLREKPAVALSYSFPPGHEGLRHQIARRLAMAGCAASADDIIITSGCTEALCISLGAVVRRGETVAIESPAYYALLEWLDRLNRWLFAPWSPLNWFTKRRRMWISPRLPEGREAGERLWNGAGIGDVRLDNEGAPTAIRQLNAGGGGTIFKQRAKDD